MLTMKCTVFYKNEYSVQNKRSKKVGCLSGWLCRISYADVGDISSQRGIDYNGRHIIDTHAQCAGIYVQPQSRNLAVRVGR